jgi:hypothetical protein
MNKRKITMIKRINAKWRQQRRAQREAARREEARHNQEATMLLMVSVGQSVQHLH